MWPINFWVATQGGEKNLESAAIGDMRIGRAFEPRTSAKDNTTKKKRNRAKKKKKH